MQISIDYNYLLSVLLILKHNPIVAFWILLVRGGWLLFVISIIVGLYYTYLYHIRRKFIRDYGYTMLAIDVPKNNEQSIKAIEELFNTIHGIKHGRTQWEIYTKGDMQLWLSLEIVSIEGYIQFLIRAPKYYVPTVTSTIYAHYPEAEITEVEDYMSLIPSDIWKKESKYKSFLMDLSFKKPDFYPLKTYSEFEHSMSQTFIDPMASLLEIMSKIGPGEFLGVMFLVRPSDNKFMTDRAEKVISKMMGRATETTDRLIDKMFNGINKGIDYFSESVYSLWGDIEDSAQEEKVKLNLLTSNERNTITAIENKLSKIIFETRVKTCYIAPKEKYMVAKGRFTIQGSFKQFENYNQWDFEKNTTPDYWGKEARIRSLTKDFIRRYINRDTFESKSIFLSTEELATLYHFPTITVKAPMLRTTGTKTTEPPYDLPLEKNSESIFLKDNVIDEKLNNKEVIDLNKNNEEIDNLDLDNKKYEAKFTKNQNEKDKYIKEFRKDEEGKIFQNAQNNLSSIKKDESNVNQGENKNSNTPPDNLPIIE